MSVQLAAPDFRWAADKVQFTPETSMTRRPLPAALAAPGVTQVTLAGAIGTRTDDKRVFPRTEYHCARCGGHHGHAFNGGPRPTGSAIATTASR
jgi:hypothetical protein